jgi:hypothetical protein
VFENFNAGLYLRQHERTADDCERIREYYAANSVPFDAQHGFDERRAAAANPGWARRFGVQRTRLEQFRLSTFELARSGGRRVTGW